MNSMCRHSLYKLRVDEEDFRQWLRNGPALEREIDLGNLAEPKDPAYAVNTVASRLPLGVPSIRISGVGILYSNGLGVDLTSSQYQVFLLTIFILALVRMIFWFNLRGRYGSLRHLKTKAVPNKVGLVATPRVVDGKPSDRSS
ncbi:hypothetical protein H0H92_014644 [Tricholoma furcatifolium]|nr:hypothetical protein H0H92_014644 [Tricholoma furcatifolium]